MTSQEEEIFIDQNDNEVIMIEPSDADYTFGDENGVIDLIDSESDSSPSISSVQSEVIQINRIKLNPVQEVLRVLPNAKLMYVEEIFQKYEGAENAINDVIDDMLEGGYQLEITETYDFTSTSWTTSKLYRCHALLVLQSNFPYLQVDGLSRMFESNNHHYYLTYRTILDLTACVTSYNALGLIHHVYSPAFTANLAAKCAVNPDLTIQEVPKSLTATHFDLMEPVLQQELHWLDNKTKSDLEIIDMRIAEELNEAALAAGLAVECGCCCAEYAPQNMRKCTKGHQFCRNCISRYVEQTVFGDGRSQLKCMNTTGKEACKGHFSETTLRLSLRGKVFQHYCEAVAREAVSAAQLDSRMKTCHFCQLRIEVDTPIVAAAVGDAAATVTVVQTMVCPNCYKSTCTQCGEEAHAPLKCNEVERKGQTNRRVTVEEAMTRARVRECPRCNTRFFKTEGCNRMTCSCGGVICYVCRADITTVDGYTHFCQTPHCDHSTCNKCRTDSNTVEDDRRAMLDAGLKTLQEMEAEALAAMENECGPKIEIKKFLEGGI